MWRALTAPDEVTRWSGVMPHRVPAYYPRPGDYAIWRDDHTGVLLHDVIVRAEPNRRLTSRLKLGSALVNEDYLLRADGPRRTHLRAAWRGAPALAAGNDVLMRRLKAWCETPVHG